jgi:glycosyltransferase involved in cell wall biosynthesis
MRVIVVHPGLQHAHQLAWALEEAGWLAGFWSGVPVTDSRGNSKELWARLNSELRPIPVPAARRRHFPAFPLARRVVSKLLSPEAASRWIHRLDHAFDAFVAPQLARHRPDIVVAYENAALRTFRAAKRAGALCVLDAASVHYRAGQNLIADVMDPNPAWVNKQKEEEVCLADVVLTCSELAADTYRAAGIPSSKVIAVPLGADLPVESKQSNFETGVCSFVFAGSMSRRKGVDLLLDVFQRFIDEGVAAKLTLIGGPAEPDLVQRSRRLSNVTYVPFLPQAQLFGEISRHHCLVLPSRFDSFGMVVPEAMACGVPAIVSEWVGAKCIVEEHPDSGWIVQCNVESLYECIAARVGDAASLRPAGEAARLAAGVYSWAAYRERIKRLFAELPA